MTVLGMLAWCAAAVSLWLGARRYDSAVARAYRWLAAGAALYCAGLVIQGIRGGTLNPAPGLGFTDLPSLLALAAVAVGIAMLTMAERDGGPSMHRPQPAGHAARPTISSARPKSAAPGRESAAPASARREQAEQQARRVRCCPGSRTATSWPSRCW